MLLKNINLSLRYEIVLLSSWWNDKEKIYAIWAFIYVLLFKNHVDSPMAYHYGAIIETLSKNYVPFDVGD